MSYDLVVDGRIAASDSYTVLEGGVERKLPPIVFAAIYDALLDPSILNETFGLGPRGCYI